MNTPITTHSSQTLGVGICGAGERGTYVLGRRIEESTAENALEIRGLYDRNPRRSEESRSYLCKIRPRGENEITIHKTLDDLLTDPRIDIVLITSHTVAHRPQAEAVLAAGKYLYLDKPIATTLEDALAIQRAEKASRRRIIMGFTRRYEPSWRRAFTLCEEGRIGDTQMILLRSIIPYARYLQRWHRLTHLSGGAFNDKCSHHFDVFRWFAQSPAIRVQATGGRSQTFAPDPTAPRYCRECDRICPFRALPGNTVKDIGIVHRLDKDFQTVSGDRWMQDSWLHPERKEDIIDACVFDPHNDMWDYLVATVNFASGLVATLFWNIFGLPTEDQETMEIIGTSGKILLERGTGKVTLTENYGANTEVFTPSEELTSSHFGADLQLVHDIANIKDGEPPPASVSDGVESLRLIDASRRSVLSGGNPILIKELP